MLIAPSDFHVLGHFYPFIVPSGFAFGSQGLGSQSNFQLKIAFRLQFCLQKIVVYYFFLEGAVFKVHAWIQIFNNISLLSFAHEKEESRRMDAKMGRSIVLAC